VALVRRFVQQRVPPKASLEGGRAPQQPWMTGAELATLVERLVPRLNDMGGAARYGGGGGHAPS
jgi:hypothetical protein